MNLLVSGATGQIGSFLLPRLQQAGIGCVALSRNAQASRFGERWLVCDLSRDNPFAAAGAVDAWVHLGFLPLAVPWIKAAARAGITRLVAFSSTSVFTKQGSSSAGEQQLIGELRDAEDAVARQCGEEGIGWTLMRPTMIYGGGRDLNVSFVQAMVRRFGFFPLAGGGRGLRQPVHADDLAAAVVAVLATPSAHNRFYNLGGGEVLSYRRFVERIFATLGRQPRFLPLPLALAAGLASVARHLPGCGHVTPAMFERMAADLVFDYTEASRDFNYDPRPFQP